MITVRAAFEKDIPAITSLMDDLGYPTSEAEMKVRFDDFNTHHDYLALVAVVDKRVAGFIGLVKNYYYEHNGFYVRVGALVVDKNYRNIGIGKILMNEAEKWATEIGANSVLLNSGQREERMAAYAFYKHLGYEIKTSGFVKYL